MIKKYSDPHTCVVTGASQDNSRLDSDMISNIILSIVNVSPRILVPVLIANIYS